MSGYSAEVVADLIESTVDRYMRRGRGSTNSSAVLADLEHGWAKLSWRARQVLSRYVFDELPPPAIDIEATRQSIKRSQELGEPHHQQSREIRETMALHLLGKEMGQRKREPFMVNAGPAHRGECSVCGRYLDRVLVWRDPKTPRRWCVHHGPNPT